jgi:transcriptional regulator with XRE-family HTH domain
MHLTSAAKKALLTGIGTEIKRRRQKLGISQVLLAAKAGVHPNVAGLRQRGKYNPSELTLEAITAALNTSTLDVLRKMKS